MDTKCGSINLVALTVLLWADGNHAGSTPRPAYGGSPPDPRDGGRCTTFMTGLMLERLTRHLGLILIGLITIDIQIPTIGETSSYGLMRRLIGYMGDGNLSAGSAGRTVIHIVRTAGERLQIIIVRLSGVGGCCALGISVMNVTPSVTAKLEVPGEASPYARVLLQFHDLLSDCNTRFSNAALMCQSGIMTIRLTDALLGSQGGTPVIAYNDG